MTSYVQFAFRRLGAFTALLLSCSGLFAQFETATLTGVLTDPLGAVVANANVKLSNQATNLEAIAVTDDEGRYSFSALRPGTYVFTASAAGFKQYVSTGLVLQVNQAARVDVQLSVGDVSERIQVTADAPMLEIETAARGAVVDQTKIVELPLNGRDYNQLALFSPGVLAPTPRLQGIGLVLLRSFDWRARSAVG